MATQTRTFLGVQLPDIRKGTPVFRGFRHRLNYRTTFNAALDDDIIIEAKVPPQEFWQVRMLTCGDLLGNTGALGEQSWDRLILDVEEMLHVSSSASAAAPSPTDDFDSSYTALYSPAWELAWDGAVNVAWEDANEARLFVRDTDPTFSPSLWLPGQKWRLRCEGATVASGAERAFTILLLVDRFMDPEQHWAKVFASEQHEQLLRDVHYSGHAPLVRG